MRLDPVFEGLCIIAYIAGAAKLHVELMEDAAQGGSGLVIASATIALERSFWRQKSAQKSSVTLQPASSDEQVAAIATIAYPRCGSARRASKVLVLLSGWSTAVLNAHQIDSRNCWNSFRCITRLILP